MHYHAEDRTTSDVDVLTGITPQNAGRLHTAIVAVLGRMVRFTVDDLALPQKHVPLGREGIEFDIPTAPPVTTKEPIIMRRFLNVSLLLLCAASNLTAQSKDDPAKRLVGAWRLVSVEGTSPVFKFVYDRPRGIIIYDASGRMAVQQVNLGDRRPFAKGPAAGTVEEKAAAFDSYGAYYGTWTVDAKAETIIHHIEDGLNPSLRGRDNVRWFEFQGSDRVVLIPTEDGKGGAVPRKDPTYKLIWERIK